MFDEKSLLNQVTNCIPLFITSTMLGLTSSTRSKRSSFLGRTGWKQGSIYSWRREEVGNGGDIRFCGKRDLVVQIDHQVVDELFMGHVRIVHGCSTGLVPPLAQATSPIRRRIALRAIKSLD